MGFELGLGLGLGFGFWVWGLGFGVWIYGGTGGVLEWADCLALSCSVRLPGGSFGAGLSNK